MTHKCPKDSCGQQVPSHLLACRSHWYSIPMSIRAQVNRTWKRLEEVNEKGGSLQDVQREYMAARKEAIEWLNG